VNKALHVLVSLIAEAVANVELRNGWLERSWADVQKKVSVRPNPEYSEEYPRKMLAKVTVRGRMDDTLSREIKDAVRSLESIQVKDLMELLGRVRHSAHTDGCWPAATRMGPSGCGRRPAANVCAPCQSIVATSGRTSPA
jgi:hypothetical protein